MKGQTDVHPRPPAVSQNTDFGPFTHHTPTPEQIDRIHGLRRSYHGAWCAVNTLTRPGKESEKYAELARTALEEACMWAVKAIVFEEPLPPAKSLPPEVVR